MRKTKTENTYFVQICDETRCTKKDTSNVVKLITWNVKFVTFFIFWQNFTIGINIVIDVLVPVCLVSF